MKIKLFVCFVLLLPFSFFVIYTHEYTFFWLLVIAFSLRLKSVTIVFNILCLHTYLPTYLPTCLPACLPTYIQACLLAYLPTYLQLTDKLPNSFSNYFKLPKDQSRHNTMSSNQFTLNVLGINAETYGSNFVKIKATKYCNKTTMKI